MTIIHLKIRIPENREVKIELPEDFPVGEAEVTIEVSAQESELPWEERPWTQEELETLLTFEGKTLGEILDSGLIGIGAEGMKHITDSKDGELKVDLPENVVDGEVEVKVIIASEETPAPAIDDQPLTDEEIDALMQPNPKTGAEIVKNPAVGSWAHKGITDSVEFIKELRRKRRKKFE
jgi:hypothetical protein